MTNEDKKKEKQEERRKKAQARGQKPIIAVQRSGSMRPK
jgi:hypothetical protein